MDARFFSSRDLRALFSGEGDKQSIWNAFFRSLLPVGLTYSAALTSIELGYASELELADNKIHGTLGLLIVPVFTATHCVFPVFFYFIFAAVIAALKGQIQKGADVKAKLFFWVFSGFVFLHMGFWFGIPSIALAFYTGWLTIPLAVIHIACSKKGTRTWVFLEYGSTSFALLLFFMLFSVADIFPMGILVAILQILLLTILDWKARPLWLKLGNVSKESGNKNARTSVS